MKVRGLKWTKTKLEDWNEIWRNLKGSILYFLSFFLNTIIMISHSLDLAFVLLYFFFYFSLFWRYCPIIFQANNNLSSFFFFFKVKGRNLIDDKDTWHVTNPDHYNNIRPSREAAIGLQTRQLCTQKKKNLMFFTKKKS